MRFQPIGVGALLPTMLALGVLSFCWLLAGNLWMATFPFLAPQVRVHIRFILELLFAMHTIEAPNRIVLILVVLLLIFCRMVALSSLAPNVILKTFSCPEPGRTMAAGERFSPLPVDLGVVCHTRFAKQVGIKVICCGKRSLAMLADEDILCLWFLHWHHCF